jgi:thioredoxin-like negative regulator of GroEL
MMRQNRDDEALKILTEQLNDHRTDQFAMKAMATIYERRGEWERVTELRRQVWQAAPRDFERACLVVESAIRAGQIEEARRISRSMLPPGAPPYRIDQMLEVWAESSAGAEMIGDAKTLAAASGGPQKISYAAFLVRVGAAADALEMAAPQATLPVRSANLRANAIYAAGLVELGRVDAARARLAQVLDEEPNNVDALRARVRLAMRAEPGRQLIFDARNIVSLTPDSPRDRLLLAQALIRSGDRAEAEGALWDGFHDIPADGSLYRALRATLRTRPQEIARLDREYNDQVERKLAKDFSL